MHGVIRTYRVSSAADVARRLGEPSGSGVFDVSGVVAYYLLEAPRSLVSVTIFEAEDRHAVAEAAMREASWISDAAGSPVILAPSVFEAPVASRLPAAPEAFVPEGLVARLDTSYRPGDWG